VTVLPIRLAEVEMPSFLTDVLYAEGDNPTTIAEELAHAIDAHLQRSGLTVAVDAGRISPESAAPHEAVPESERRDVGKVLDLAADRVDEVLIQWDRCRAAGGATDDLVAEQRRLRTVLERLAVDVQRAVPMTTHLSVATWQDYFRVRRSTEVEPDVREELRAVRAQVARGLPVVARWRIVASLTRSHRADATPPLSLDNRTRQQ